MIAAPLLASGQEVPGLDLSEPEQPPPAREAPPRPAAEPAPPPAAEPRSPLGETGERDAALGDRVKAVQRKGFLKRGRFELGLAAPGSLNDAFFQKVGVGGHLAYDLADSFAVSLVGAYFWHLRTGNVREGKLAFESQLLESQLRGKALLDGVWSPIYGKGAWLGSRIVHFDVYLAAGVGGVWSATSGSPRNEGPHPAANVGTGLRFYPSSWLSLDLGVDATLYPDQPSLTVPSTLQKLVTASLGFTVFLPTHFEYVYP
ncbi:MAG TPA: outer membrane beta-barrel domain-containing protein [Anaeromyxobacteraceae bacterium]|jgi:outer membrane beta-barrel protein|nr:outer membrane beta-barrel domain-containing protein [Anaeromyxobacteraceae bacterium]